MPFYEYECTDCKFYVEALQKISDEPLRKCPSCKKKTMQRLVSAPVFRLKGGGWYETDFKSDGEQKRNIAGQEEAGESKAAEPKSDETRKEAPETAKSAETEASKGDAKTPEKKVEGKSAARKTVAARPVSKGGGNSGAKPSKAKSAAKKKSKRR